MKAKSVASMLIVTAALFGASVAIAAPDKLAAAADRQSAGERLAALLAAADEADLRLNPLSGLQRGDLRYADKYDDISDDHFRELKATLQSQLRDLRRIDRAALSPDERIAYDVFRYQMEQGLRGFPAGLVRLRQQLPIDHLFGAQVTFPQIASGEGVAAFRTLADYDNGLQRIDGFVTYLDQAIEMMRRGLRDGQVQPRVVSEKIVGQLEAALADPVEGSPYYRPVVTMPDSFGEQDRARLAQAYRAAVEERIRPALKRLSAFMQSEYLPRGRNDPPGLVALRGGLALYAAALREHTTTVLSADEIHRLGLSEVARIRSEMETIRRRVAFSGSLPDFFRHLRDDTRFQFRSNDEMLAAYQAIHLRVAAALPRLFATQPKGRFEIRPVPPEQESSASAAYYVVGTPDDSRPGVFFVNTSNLPTRTSPRMTALFLHEALPGHHMQGSIAQENENLPALLRFGWSPAFMEGWALYCERLGTEMGLYDDPYQQFGRLDMEMIRAVRLVVDTGLHAKAWHRERAIRYMLDNTSLDRAAVEQEIDRYIVWPGQATAYKVGELFIRRLRSKAESRLGPRFDVRAFHDQVLRSGTLPLAVLARKIDDWIARLAAGDRTG